MRRREAHARWEDNRRVQELVAKKALTESNLEELRRYTGWGGLSDFNAGQFFTPSVVGQFVHDLLDPEPGSKVLDPQAGIGRLLEPWAGEHLISAVEVDPTAGRALRHLYSGGNVAIGSCPEAELPVSSFDYVVANPPFGIRADVEVPWKAKKPVMETWTFDLVKRVLKPSCVVR